MSDTTVAMRPTFDRKTAETGGDLKDRRALLKRHHHSGNSDSASLSRASSQGLPKKRAHLDDDGSVVGITATGSGDAAVSEAAELDAMFRFHGLDYSRGLSGDMDAAIFDSVDPMDGTGGSGRSAELIVKEEAGVDISDSFLDDLARKVEPPGRSDVEFEQLDDVNMDEIDITVVSAASSSAMGGRLGVAELAGFSAEIFDDGLTPTASAKSRGLGKANSGSSNSLKGAMPRAQLVSMLSSLDSSSKKNLRSLLQKSESEKSSDSVTWQQVMDCLGRVDADSLDPDGPAAGQPPQSIWQFPADVKENSDSLDSWSYQQLRECLMVDGATSTAAAGSGVALTEEEADLMIAWQLHQQQTQQGGGYDGRPVEWMWAPNAAPGAASGGGYGVGGSAMFGSPGPATAPYPATYFYLSQQALGDANRNRMVSASSIPMDQLRLDSDSVTSSIDSSRTGRQALASNPLNIGALASSSSSSAGGAGSKRTPREKTFARGNYRCGKCGMYKVNHVCEFTDVFVLNVGTQVSAPIVDPFTNAPFPGDKWLRVTPPGTVRPSVSSPPQLQQRAYRIASPGLDSLSVSSTANSATSPLYAGSVDLAAGMMELTSNSRPSTALGSDDPIISGTPFVTGPQGQSSPPSQQQQQGTAATSSSASGDDDQPFTYICSVEEANTQCFPFFCF